MYTSANVNNPSHGDIDEALQREYGTVLPFRYMYLIGSGIDLYGVIDLLDGYGQGQDEQPDSRNSWK